VTVLAPNDDIVLEVLRDLEYTNVKVVEDFETVKIKGLTLTFTPSALPEGEPPEHGFIVHDGNVTLWNQIDTVVTPPMIEYMHQLYGRPDFAHVRFEPLLEGNFGFHQSLKLPFDEYASFLKVVKALRPGFIVPGSAAFRYCDRYDFLNRYSFPTSPQQFLTDMADFCPDIGSSLFFPGDVAEISPQGVEIRKGHSGFVRVDETDTYVLEFKPIHEVTPIRTLTEDAAEHEEQRRQVTEFIEKEMTARLMKSEMAEVWAHWKVSYQLEVFGKEDSDIWTVDFAREPRAEKAVTGKINLYEGISCSELYRLMKGRTNWNFVGASAQYRTFHNIYRVDDGQFQFFPQENKFPQPLRTLFPPDHEMERQMFLKDVKRWKDKA